MDRSFGGCIYANETEECADRDPKENFWLLFFDGGDFDSYHSDTVFISGEGGDQQPGR